MKRWRILFDYDDTLIFHDNDGELKVITDYLGIEYNEEVKQSIISLYKSMSSRFLNRRVTKEAFYTLAQEKLQILRKYDVTLEDFFEAQVYKDNNYPMLVYGAHEVLGYLKEKGYFMCIFTNGFYNEQVSCIKSQGIYTYFDKIYAWDEYYAKPDRRAFIRAIDGTDPKANIMVGNSIKTDIIPAKKLGIYTYGINLDKRDGIMPDVELNSLKDLMTYL